MPRPALDSRDLPAIQPDRADCLCQHAQIYGRPERLPVDERHPLRPVDVNGINKLAGEFYHRLYNDVYELPACVLRLTNTYGPRMRIKDARQTFVGVWIRLLLEGKSFEVWGGQQLRDFTYVDDCVEALLLAAVRPEAAGQVFNLGGGEITSLVDLARLLIGFNGAGHFEQREFPTDRKRIDIGDYYADDALIRRNAGLAAGSLVARRFQTHARFLPYQSRPLPLTR